MRHTAESETGHLPFEWLEGLLTTGRFAGRNEGSVEKAGETVKCDPNVSETQYIQRGTFQ